ncbi:MAG: MGMT family protein [Chloroflexi bacterium]|nr:MGMT family protein [Chloroflexota bacterium]
MFVLVGQPIAQARRGRVGARTFAGRVYVLVARVPPGRVITYGAIAQLLGDPRKAREVGWAMAAMPEQTPPIPAHRVINARGKLSGEPHNRQSRRARLEAEGVHFSAEGRIDLDRYLWLPSEA